MLDAYEERSNGLVFLRILPQFEPLRVFKELVPKNSPSETHIGVFIELYVAGKTALYATFLVNPLLINASARSGPACPNILNRLPCNSL